ncbi:hypothetical protein UK99_12615 [Frankia casuarinae]|uniref:hypothetical protein n=1 Tax=Frankia casuarinae (strain DSM 45818 / CECT 9043 / HFP020203 / CcI3) TaxID=106370 RepID=UPI000A0FF76A|nr:hypothetical protein [Frankia casuarinae]ORT95529.1 hypothetical protein UK99_12615 [Frankia casuarinae]
MDDLRHGDGRAASWAGTLIDTATSGAAWLRAMLDVEAAVVRAGGRLGLVPAACVAAIDKAVAECSADVERLATGGQWSASPVGGLVATLTETTRRIHPAAAEHVHRHLTDADVVAAASLVVATHVLALADADLQRVAAGLAELVDRRRPGGSAVDGAGAPGRAARSLPTVAAGWLNDVLDARDRLARLVADGLPAPFEGILTLQVPAPLAAAREEVPGPIDGALAAVFAAEAGLSEPSLPWRGPRTILLDLMAFAVFVTSTAATVSAGMRRWAPARPEPAGVRDAAAARHSAAAVDVMVISSAIRTPVLVVSLVHDLAAELWNDNDRHVEWETLRGALRALGGSAHAVAELVEHEVTDGLFADPDRYRRAADAETEVDADPQAEAGGPGVGRIFVDRVLERYLFSAR